MDAPQLVESQREAHVVGGIEAGEDGVRGFDAQADTVRIDGVSADSQSVAGSAADGAVDGLIGLRLDENQRIITIGQDVVERVAQLDLVRAKRLSDVAGAAGTPLGEFAVFLAGSGEAAVIRALVEPQTRSDELCEQTVLVEHRLDVLGVVDDLLLGHVVHVGNCVVVMELHAGQADLGIFLHFLFQRNALAMAGAKGLVSLMDVPRACGEAESSHSKILLFDLFVWSYTWYRYAFAVGQLLSENRCPVPP